ncbi:MAG TPA: Ku protein [Streptosporangiaceae bacterium]|nr:Ku protein [Streptosporangiaceae bacterium]
MHSMWKGAISFGLVMIPVRLYAATEQKDITFRQVHRVDGGRIRFRRVCSIDGTEVAYEDVAKGYELPSGEMVIVTDEDMAELPLPTTRSIEVLHFTPAEQLDPILYNRSYYVEPDASGTRAYVLLRDALERSGRVAIAQVALRQRESLATLRSRDGVLVLETLLWPDEVRAAAFPFLDEDVDVRSQELKMAASLIDSMTVDFDASEYRDHYREALAELVNAKTEGREVVVPDEAESAGGETPSLADALKASLAAAREGPVRAVKSGTAKSGGSRSGTARSGGASSGTASSGTTRAAKAGNSSTSTSSTSTSSTGTARRSATGRAGTGQGNAAEPAAGSGTTAKPRRAASAAKGTPAAGQRKEKAGAPAEPTAAGADAEPTVQRKTRRKAS